MPDGTLKHINPLTGTEVWTVPDRAYRPNSRPVKPPKAFQQVPKENYCDFCQVNYFKTPPEKSRLVQAANGSYEKVDEITPDKLESSYAHFRRVSNLFEIVTSDYWIKNHGFQFSKAQLEWRRVYLAHAHGLEHVLNIVHTKLKLSGKTEAEILKMAPEDKLKMTDAFFGGAHELIIAGRHFKPDAEWDNDLVSSGDLTPSEHYQYLRFTIEAMLDIQANNHYVRHVIIFQNWLQPAGASLDHLHKQLVGLDEWGTSIQAELDVVREEPNIYNDSIINFSLKQNLVVAENDHAIAVSELGHRYPTLAVYSKSLHVRPDEHTEEELNGVSDLVHACHAATGNQTPCNEEWYYSPRDAVQIMPWHILIKWRTVNQAGFEGGTKIYINPLSPAAMKDLVVPRFRELRGLKKIGKIKIAEECSQKINPLLYEQK